MQSVDLWVSGHHEKKNSVRLSSFSFSFDFRFLLNSCLKKRKKKTWANTRMSVFRLYTHQQCSHISVLKHLCKLKFSLNRSHDIDWLRNVSCIRKNNDWITLNQWMSAVVFLRSAVRGLLLLFIEGLYCNYSRQPHRATSGLFTITSWNLTSWTVRDKIALLRLLESFQSLL